MCIRDRYQREDSGHNLDRRNIRYPIYPSIYPVRNGIQVSTGEMNIPGRGNYISDNGNIQRFESYDMDQNLGKLNSVHPSTIPVRNRYQVLSSRDENFV